MDLWTVIAYSAFGVSLLVSALQVGNWALRANPRAIVNAGRWSLAALGVLALGALLWLTVSGRWTQALMLAAFIMPVFAHGASRWRGLLGPLGRWRRAWRLTKPVLDPSRPMHTAETIDPELVRQSVAVLSAYLEQTRRVLEHWPADAGAANGSGRRHMAMAEALEVLGLEPGPRPDQIDDAHRRLRHQLDPDLAGSRYLTTKIDEARDVLLGN
jgi:hypothetical protein